MTPEHIQNTIATIKKDFDERGFVPEHNSIFVADLVVAYENLASEVDELTAKLKSLNKVPVAPAPK